MNGAGRNGPGRNGTLTPISTISSDSTLVSKYQQLNGTDAPYSPGLSSASYGGSPLASPPPYSDTMRDKMGNGNPSPPSSVARSSDGNGLYSAGMSQEAKRQRVARLEEALQEHYTVLKGYLASQLRGDMGPRPNRARDKLLRLSMGQFEELSTDVYDELRRREDMRLARAKNVPRYLLPIKDFHPKRNQARQKLATLPPDRFRQLATDVFFELERRFPRFSGRPGSPALSVASSKGGRSGMGSMGPPRLSNRGAGGPLGSNRVSPPESNEQGAGSPEDEYGKPLPKQFQQNTIVPNKSTMVEDESGEEEGETDLYNLSRLSKRSAKSGSSSEISQLEAKVDDLELQLQDKDVEIGKLQASHTDKENEVDLEKAEWQDVRSDLERQLADAQSLNASIQSELERLRTDNDTTERDLRLQLAEAQQQAQAAQSSHRSSTGSASLGRDDENTVAEWQQRYEALEQELRDQESLTDAVRREAREHLADMRTLSAQTSAATEAESRLIADVHSLEQQLADWKARYARVRSQLRASASGMSNVILADSVNAPPSVTTPDGAVQDVHVARFQLAVDELLRGARGSDAGTVVMARMKEVVLAARAIVTDCDSVTGNNGSGLGLPTPSSAASLSATLLSPGTPVSVSGENSKSPARLKARVSATANNLITAAKNHAAAGGLAPVSLLDAAASHLAIAVVALVRACGMRATPEEERVEDGGEESKPLPRTPETFADVMAGATRSAKSGPGNRGSDESAELSAASGSSVGRRGSGWRRSEGSSIGRKGDPGLEDLKVFIDDQTATLVSSIQPLVSTIRSVSNSSSAIDLAPIQSHIASIANTVDDIVTATSDAMRAPSFSTETSVSAATAATLEKHTGPILRVLEECRVGLLEAGEEREGIRGKVPGLAFKIARGTKELVLRVDRIEVGELTERDELSLEL
ncbi:MAG: component of the polarisome [Bathelium mastoideum]|nr:MAG: component of the polarisome [Bathelium mastoideum]